MKIDKPTIASELIIEATEMKGKRPSQLNFEELIDVVESVVKKLILPVVSKQSELISCDNGCDWRLKGIQSNDYLECSRCGKRKATNCG